MKYLTVHVTQEDIDKGVPMEGQSCPLALATRRTGFSEALVGIDHWSPDEDSWPVRLSRHAERFVDLFDNGDPVEPATFRLRLS